MAGVLGIDAAWTAKEPSGIALLEGSPGDWRCVAVAPNYDSFLTLAAGVPIDWSIKSRGAILDVGRLVAAAEKLFDEDELTVVTVDMPLSTEPIIGRREADTAISRAFGGRGAAVHSPSAERPGVISDQLCKDFAAAGFALATATTPAGTPDRLVEVYPHSALMKFRSESVGEHYAVLVVRRSRAGGVPAAMDLLSDPVALVCRGQLQSRADGYYVT